MAHHHQHGHAHDHNGRQAGAVETVVVTASQDFQGPVGGYVTMDYQQQQQQQQEQQAARQSAAAAQNAGPAFFDAGNPAFATLPTPQPQAAPPTAGSFAGSANPSEIVGAPVQYTPKATPAAGSPSQAANTGAPIVGSPINKGRPTASAPSSSSNGASQAADGSISASPSSTSALQSSNQSSGMSGGAKAGLAFGIILIIGILGGLAFFVYKHKKKQNNKHQKLENEKSGFNDNGNSLTSHVSVRRAKTQAPRLSLRPMTEMFPDEKQQQQQPQQDVISVGGNNLAVPSAAAQKPRSPNGNSSNQFSEKNDPSSDRDLSNPFGDHAMSQKPSQDSLNGPGPMVEAPKPLSVKSPNGNADRGGSMVPPPAAGASGSGPGPNNVHRVQLDFKPSMEDELELVAGQVVRMLHEYDDGWALCIRLDRSQQGVVPRSCLSKLPIKPRPAGPPPPHMRGPPPNGRQRGPPGPQGRPMSPAGMPPGGGRVRSQSNTPNGQGRPMSPGPFGSGQYGPPSDPRQRSNSASATAARRITPPGTSPMNSTSTSPTQASGVPSRKPVPGQAM